MDYGQYGDAEATYRKALSFDPNFLIGQSVLGRITRDLEERQKIHQVLLEKRGKIQGAERKILDVYIALVYYTNLREEASKNTANALQKAYKTGEKNLREIVYQYPGEIYLKSEYIEILHALYGPKQALDTLDRIILPIQHENPFLIGYQAIMHAELKNFDKALVLAKKLEQKLTGYPKASAILADIYYKKGDFQNANTYVNKAIEMDSLNLDASRLKVKIELALTDK